jgi:hypothetical protein
MEFVAAVATVLGAISAALSIYDWFKQRNKKSG